MWMWEDRCVCFLHVCCRWPGGKGHDDNERSLGHLHIAASTFFFHSDIRLFEVAAVYIITHSVTDDSLLFSATSIFLSSKQHFHRMSVFAT